MTDRKTFEQLTQEDFGEFNKVADAIIQSAKRREERLRKEAEKQTKENDTKENTRTL